MPPTTARERRPMIAPEAITLDYSPRRREDVVGVELDGELVLYHPTQVDLHKLNGVATVLWNSFDGSVTLRELSEDLQAVIEGAGDEVAKDVLCYARQLGSCGLLAGVSAQQEP